MRKEGDGGGGLSIVSMKQDVLDIQNNALIAVYFETNNVLGLLHAFKNRILIIILYQDKSYFVKKV